MKSNKNFRLEIYDTKGLDKKLFTKQGFLKTLPKNYNNQFLIDGFFAAKLIKND